MSFKDATTEQISEAADASWEAFLVYRQSSLKKRSGFMHAIADEIESMGDELLQTAARETNLPDARLKNEKARTVFQLRSYADTCAGGQWMDIRIDTANPDRNPPKPDIRKMLVPLGPVVVFGASNFPFAYSTAGGDTACAFAAGCPVIVKAHPAHAETSELVADAIRRAVIKMKMPPGIFHHIHGSSFRTGETLVKHPKIKAVGFTGSFQGGKSLFDWAQQREEPIPVFAEMGSINPVFLFPEKLSTDAEESAKALAGSVTLSVGQFCTNPGLMIAIEGEGLRNFITNLSAEIKKSPPAKMLHEGIASGYVEKRKKALEQKGVSIVEEAEKTESLTPGTATIATATAEAFINNPVLHQEVFGPYSLIIVCKSENEMLKVAKCIEGQLTASVFATERDAKNNKELLQQIELICGRYIFNGVPTGVEVCWAMQHGGPFPATTDSRFTSVGADGIKRFARPIAYQNWPESLLPDELKNANPLNIWRTVDCELTKSGLP